MPLLLVRVTGNQYKLSVRIAQGTETNIVLFGSYVVENFRAFVSVKTEYTSVHNKVFVSVCIHVGQIFESFVYSR